MFVTLFKRYAAKVTLLAICGLLLGLRVPAQDRPDGQPLEGKSRSFYKSGALKEKGHYHNAGKTGLWYYYAENGVLEKKEKYREGRLLWQVFFDNGKVSRTIDRNGKVRERPKCGC